MKYKYYNDIFTLYFNITILIVCAVDTTKYCEIKITNGECITKYENYNSHFTRKRYIFYDINPSEGFNLRRDVYIRVATFVKKLTENDASYQWNLVLPPWGNLYHWQSYEIKDQKLIPWGKFFDLHSLRQYVPVLEMYEFFQENSIGKDGFIIDQVYILRNDEEMFKTGNFKDTNIITACPKTIISYKKNNKGRFSGYFWGYMNITASSIKCITFHGSTFDLKKHLKPYLYRTIMFDRMEIPLHHMYGSSEYWKARRSMRYNSELYDVANTFRLLHLNSNDIDDNTQKIKDWRKELVNGYRLIMITIHIFLIYFNQILKLSSRFKSLILKLRDLALYNKKLIMISVSYEGRMLTTHKVYVTFEYYGSSVVRTMLKIVYLTWATLGLAKCLAVILKFFSINCDDHIVEYYL